MTLKPLWTSVLAWAWLASLSGPGWAEPTDANHINPPQQQRRSKDLSGQLNQVLLQPSVARFTDVPLAEVLQFYRDFHQVEIVFLGDDTLLDRRIRVELTDLSFRLTLLTVLKPLELSFYEKDNVLRVISSDVAQRQFASRVYTVPAWAHTEISTSQLQMIVRAALGNQDADTPEVACIRGIVVVSANEEQHARLAPLFERLKDASQDIAPAVR